MKALQLVRLGVGRGRVVMGRKGMRYALPGGVRLSLELPCPWGCCKGTSNSDVPALGRSGLFGSFVHSFIIIEFLCWAMYWGTSNPVLVLVNLSESC